MAVTRIEGIGSSVQVGAEPTTAQRTPRPAAEVKKREEEERTRVEEAETPKPEARALFKPYSLSFRFVEELNRVVVKVIDPETGEAVREIPPESVIETLKVLKQQSGRLVDEEA